MTEQGYQRLARGRRRTNVGVAVSAGLSSLWLGPDHLLSIDSTGYTEEYKRFYYRDIQAITIRRTSRRGIGGLLIMPPLFIFSLLTVFVNEPGLQIFFGIIAGVLGLMLVYNFAAGPTTVCYLRSAVQTEELPAMNRLRRARKALARLQPLIAAAQGELSSAELSSRVSDFFAEKPASPVPVQNMAPAPASPMANE
jgi:hypothetical protein